MVRIINPWNTRQIARMEELINEAKQLNHRVAWREHLHELGHTLHAVNTMASTIYKRMRSRNRAPSGGSCASWPIRWKTSARSSRA